MRARAIFFLAAAALWAQPPAGFRCHHLE